MAEEHAAVLSVRGDYGNPSGSGLAKITLQDVFSGEDVGVSDKSADMTTLHAALVTAQCTATTLGTKSLVGKLPASPQYPGASVNVDRVLFVEYQINGSSKVRNFTIPGVPAASTSLELIDNGERLNAAGKTAIGNALIAFLGLQAGDLVVLRGKVLQKS